MIFFPTALSPIQRATAPVARKGRQPSRFSPNIKPRAWLMKVFCIWWKIVFILLFMIKVSFNTREIHVKLLKIHVRHIKHGGLWLVCVCRGRSWRCKGEYDSSISDYHFCAAIFKICPEDCLCRNVGTSTNYLMLYIEKKMIKKIKQCKLNYIAHSITFLGHLSKLYCHIYNIWEQINACLWCPWSLPKLRNSWPLGRG